MYFSKGKIPQKFISESFRRATQLKKTIYPGAISTFSGIVRNDNIGYGKKIKYIDYKFYDFMAQKKMREIYAEIWRENKLDFLVMVHGTGKIKTGELSLFILAASKHSKPSLKAVKDAVRLIKTTVPIWKKEVFEDGSSKWVE